MTIQTKHFIELSDIVSVRFDCKHCAASFSLSLDDRLRGVIDKCPSCGRGWTVLNGSSYESLFTDLTKLVKRISESVEGPLGCKMLLEIKSPPKP